MIPADCLPKYHDALCRAAAIDREEPHRPMTEPFLIRPEILDGDRRRRAVEGLRAAQVTLPSWSELADPARIPAAIVSSLKSVGPDEPDAKNLWRVHWFNDVDRRDRVPVPGHVVLPEALTGVKAPVVVLLGRRFPLIGAHKVLAAYACLVPRLVTGQFEPTHDRAVWPSTGNYCRGGVAISRILGCRGVAVLPAGMSRERFDWLQEWVSDPGDIIRTPGTESNVKEIYDKCDELARDEHNVMLTDLVVGVSDLTTDSLNLLFGGNVGRSYLAGRRKIDPDVVRTFDDIGISGLANIVAAIKVAKHLDFSADDVVMTVATDSALLYASERRSFLARRYGDGFDEVNAGEIFSRHLEGIVDDHVLELTHFDRKRIFNLGYYTWVEQQGVAIDDFDRRKDRRFWRGLV